MRHALRNARTKTAREQLTPSEIRRLERLMDLDPSEVQINENQGHWLQSHAYLGGDGRGGQINVGKDTPPSVLAHEMGHLTHGRSRLETALAELSTALTPLAATIPSLIAMQSAHDSDWSRAAPYLGGALIAPKLLTEGLASYRGLTALNEVRPDVSMLPAILAQLTYPVTLASTSILAPVLVTGMKAQKAQRQAVAAKKAPPKESR